MNGKRVVAWIQLVLGVVLLLTSVVATIMFHSSFTTKANKELKDIRTFYDTTTLTMSAAEKTFHFNRDQDMVSQFYHTKVFVLYSSLVTWAMVSVVLVTHGITSLNEY